jgi:hypothetical protein
MQLTNSLFNGTDFSFTHHTGERITGVINSLTREDGSGSKFIVGIAREYPKKDIKVFIKTID